LASDKVDKGKRKKREEVFVYIHRFHEVNCRKEKKMKKKREGVLNLEGP